MNLNQLYYFKTLAELEHYTKAAEKLNISQPTLSHSISSMEKELGANLFEKQGRNVVLTKYGRIYMFYVENALTQLELGKNQIERLVSEGGGHVGLAYMTSVGTNFVPGLIAGFLDDPQNKNISFSCYEGNTKTLLYNLKREKYDLVFCSMVEAESDVEFIPVFEQSLVVILPEGHPLEDRKKVTIRIFARILSSAIRRKAACAVSLMICLQRRRLCRIFFVSLKMSILWQVWLRRIRGLPL